MNKQKQRMSILEHTAYGAGDMSLSISIISASLLIYAFMVNVVGLTPVDAGWVLLVVRLIDAISDPLMGWLSVRVGTKWGRYRPWIFIGSVPFGISLFLLFTIVGDSYQAKLIWTTSAYIFNSLMFTVIAIPYISLIGVITNDPAERIKANTFRFPMAKAATLIVTTFVPYYVTKGSDPESAYATVFFALGVVSVAVLMFCAFNVKERVTINPPKNVPVKTQLNALLQNDQWLILCLTMILLLVAFATRGNIAFIYGTEFAKAGNGWEIGVFMGMWSVGGVAGALISKWLTDRYSKLLVFRWSLYGSAVMAVIMYFVVGVGDFYLAVLFYFLCCAFSEINSPILWASIGEVGFYGETKTGINTSGLSIGLVSFSQKLGMSISGPITGYTLAYIGYEAGAELSLETLMGLSMAVTFIPALFFMISGLVFKKYFISNRYFKEMMMNNQLPGISCTREEAFSRSGRVK
ncbi:MFS transporter [Vibrio viridaestus]|uniref:MFS transporter n=1 Tax=Vibrio viridaestus TaxID=2487322 RepID=A0A3N9TDD2_9VIBR|nr:glycoside-pentoside-hexuronide (GPH):cation symporter [Vibrio viridaestus]RQW62060.1 MFS transporter [Vibrio viridaestus]